MDFREPESGEKFHRLVSFPLGDIGGAVKLPEDGQAFLLAAGALHQPGSVRGLQSQLQGDAPGFDLGGLDKADIPAGITYC